MDEEITKNLMKAFRKNKVKRPCILTLTGQGAEHTDAFALVEGYDSQSITIRLSAPVPKTGQFTDANILAMNGILKYNLYVGKILSINNELLRFENDHYTEEDGA